MRYGDDIDGGGRLRLLFGSWRGYKKAAWARGRAWLNAGRKGVDRKARHRDRSREIRILRTYRAANPGNSGRRSAQRVRGLPAHTGWRRPEHFLAPPAVGFH